MSHQRQNFYRALSVLNHLLIFVFFLFLIELLNSLFSARFSLIFVFLIIGPLKLYVMSGIGGCILEILSGEEMVPQVRRIHQNAKVLWPGFLMVFVIIRFVDFSLFVLFPVFRMWRPVYFAVLGVVATYALAQWAINKKYIRLQGFPRRRLKFDLRFLLVIISAYLLEMALGRVSANVHIGDFQWRTISAFMINYIHVFVFIFCSLFILDGYPEVNEKLGSSKEIFLINPMGGGVVQSLVFLVYWVVVRSYPPFFVVLKALSPKTYKFREFNRVIWHGRYYKSNVLVCITCFTSNCYEAYKIAKEFKKEDRQWSWEGLT